MSQLSQDQQANAKNLKRSLRPGGDIRASDYNHHSPGPKARPETHKAQGEQQGQTLTRTPSLRCLTRLS